MNTGYHRPTGHNHVQEGGGRDLPMDGRRQHVKSARVYIFGDGNVEEEELADRYEVEMRDLRARGAPKKQLADKTTKVEEGRSYFEKPLSDDDTLLGVALKYGCRVAELKRINNLIQDQEFYGLKVVRIPLHRHGILTEYFEEHVTNADTYQTGTGGGATAHNSVSDYDVMEDDDDYDLETDTEHRALLVRNLSIRDVFGTQSREAANFLKQMDTDIKNIVQNTNSRKDTLEEVRDTLTCKSIHPLHKSRTMFDGVDCGMRWWSIMIVMLVLLLGCPLLYFLYFEYVKPSS